MEVQPKATTELTELNTHSDALLGLSLGSGLLVLIISACMVAGVIYVIRRGWRFFNRRDRLDGSVDDTNRSPLYRK